MHRKPGLPLRRREHVPHERAEGLHRDVDARIEHQRRPAAIHTVGESGIAMSASVERSAPTRKYGRRLLPRRVHVLSLYLRKREVLGGAMRRLRRSAIGF